MGPPTPSRTSIPQGTTTSGRSSLDINIFEHLLRREERREARAVARDGLQAGTETRETWRCSLRRGVKFHDGSDFDSADVKFSFDRVLNAQVVKQAAANTPSSLLVEPQERDGRTDATSSRSTSRRRSRPGSSFWRRALPGSSRATSTSRNRLQGEQRASGRNRAVPPDAVHAGSAGRVRAVRRLLGPPGPERRRHPSLLLEVVDDEARARAGRDRHGVPDVHADRAHVARQGEKASACTRGRARSSATSCLNVEREPFNNINVRRALAYMMPRAGDRRPGVSRDSSSRSTRCRRRGCPVTSTRSRARYGRAPNIAAAKRELQRAGVSTPVPDRDLVDADALR